MNKPDLPKDPSPLKFKPCAKATNSKAGPKETKMPSVAPSTPPPPTKKAASSQKKIVKQTMIKYKSIKLIIKQDIGLKVGMLLLRILRRVVIREGISVLIVNQYRILVN